MCRADRRSADDFKICHTGAKVPCTQQLPACFANFANNFELFSSIFDLKNNKWLNYLINNPIITEWNH